MTSSTERMALADAEGDLRHCIAIASREQPGWRSTWEEALARLLREPAAGEVRYAHSQGETMSEMRDHIRTHPMFLLGDAVLCWVNEGDLYTGMAVQIKEGSQP